MGKRSMGRDERKSQAGRDVRGYAASFPLLQKREKWGALMRAGLVWRRLLLDCVGRSQQEGMHVNAMKIVLLILIEVVVQGQAWMIHSKG